MNAAVQSSTAQQPYFAFFSRPAPRVVGTRLPTVTGEDYIIYLFIYYDFFFFFFFFFTSWPVAPAGFLQGPGGLP